MLSTWTGRPSPRHRTGRRRGSPGTEIFSSPWSWAWWGRCLCVWCWCSRHRTEASPRTFSWRARGNRRILWGTKHRWEWTASKWIVCHTGLESSSPPSLGWRGRWSCPCHCTLCHAWRAGKAGRGRCPVGSHNWWRSEGHWWRVGFSLGPEWTLGECCLLSRTDRSSGTENMFIENFRVDVFSLEKILRVREVACCSWKARRAWRGQSSAWRGWGISTSWRRSPDTLWRCGWWWDCPAGSPGSRGSTPGWWSGCLSGGCRRGRAAWGRWWSG